MKALYTTLAGYFGNQMFQYAAARAGAERDGYELRTPEWAGEKIFMLPKVKRPEKGDTELPGFHQCQESSIYTRTQAREWFRFKPEVEAILLKGVEIKSRVWHFRDYGSWPGLGTISISSYAKAVTQFESNPCVVDEWFKVSEANALKIAGCENFDFLPDFYRLMKAQVLFRANSTFSWWAATLGNGKVYSPVMDGKPGGPVDVNFVEGNHPRCSSNFPFLTDVHLKP